VERATTNVKFNSDDDADWVKVMGAVKVVGGEVFRRHRA
jgi:hypothetical protein